jgi:hypothetical protein
MARKAFLPTPAIRETVRRLSGLGLPQEDIAKIVGCAPKTLRKHLRAELDVGQAEANATVAGYLFNAAKAGDLAATIFWLKTQAGWGEDGLPQPDSKGASPPPKRTVVVLPDNGRCPALTQALYDGQEKARKAFYARKARQQKAQQQRATELAAIQADDGGLPTQSGPPPEPFNEPPPGSIERAVLDDMRRPAAR